ncbi:MAG: type 1 glutamine amidotransferase domain-containing protein [Pseudomonadota bacterium]
MFAIVLAITALALAIYLGLPALLRRLGLHPHYHGARHRLPGKRALIVTTSHARLDPTSKATGVFASEMTVPYYAFLDAGMLVDVASVRGGQVPVERDSLRWPLATPDDRRYLADPVLRAKTENALAIGALDGVHYDIVFLAGGWGAAYDLGKSPELGTLVTRAWAAGKVVGGICHGPLGLLLAHDTDGTPLVRGKRLTAVTDRQLQQLGIDVTPMHPERELRAAGAVFECRHALRDPFANLTVVDGRLVTGQNQNAGAQAAQAMLRAAGAPATPAP